MLVAHFVFTDDWTHVPNRPRLSPAMADVRRAVRESLASAGVVAGDLVLVAVSGGADSMALAEATRFEGERAGIRVGAVIVEHGLQEATKEVAANVAERLRSAGMLPVEVVSVSVSQDAGTGMEAAARDARYAALQDVATKAGARFVLLGHTLNDQAETVLLGLARGSGSRSIWGMSEVHGVWLRPLLGISRATTEAFCTDSGIDFWSDPQNFDNKFTRVRVRQELLPELEKQLGPGVVSALARTAQLLREDGLFLEQLAQQAFERIARVEATQIIIAIEDLLALPKPLQSRLIMLAILKFSVGVSKVHIDEVLQLVTNWHGQKELTLPGVRVVRQGGELTLKSSKTLKPGAC